MNRLLLGRQKYFPALIIIRYMQIKIKGSEHLTTVENGPH